MTFGKKHTMEERLPLILAFIIPILIMLGVFVGKGIYPFGDRSFLRTDMYHQYAPFFNDFLTRLKNGESLTYAWDIGLGSNYLALFAYYLSSPFNWLLFLVPQSLIIEFMTYLIVLKIGLCGLTMTAYLQKKFRTNNLGMAIFGICYALSGYMAAYSWNIMWLDCLWLAPLILLGLERLVKENRPFLYCVTLAAAILTNYYISIMLCIFLVLYFVCQMILLPRKTVGQYLARVGNFALFSLIAGGIAAILLIPAAHALMTTASANTTFPTTVTSYFSIVEMLARHLVDVEVEIGLDHWPNLYSGILVFLFLPMYFMNSKVSYKEKIVKTILLFVLLLSFSLNIPNYIWHGFHYPNSLPARQSFLYTLVLLTMCFEGFQGFGSLPRGKLVGCFWGSAGLILILEKLITDDAFAFHVFYASLLFLGLYALILYLQKTRRVLSSTAFVLLMGILVVEMGLNTAVTSVTITSRTAYWQNTDTYRQLLADVEAADSSLFYRVEKDTRRTKNDGAWVGYDSASLFSSTTHAGISAIYRDLGLEGNTNAYSFTGATPFTSSLLGVKYLLTTEELPESSLYQLQSASDGVYLYENLYTLPLGFTIPSDTEDLWTYATGNPAQVQNSLAQAAAGAGEVLERVEGDASGANYQLTVQETAHLFAYIESSRVTEVTATIGSITQTYENVNRGYLLDLGVCEAGETIVLKAADEDVASLSASVYAFNEENFVAAYQALSQEPLTLTEFTNTLTETRLAGTVTAAQDCTLFTSIPYEKGWTVLVDGVPVEAEEFAGAFLTIPLTAGTHTIEMAYLPQGLPMGAMVTAGSLGLLLILALVFRFRRKTARAQLPEGEGRGRSRSRESQGIPSAPPAKAESPDRKEPPADTARSLPEENTREETSQTPPSPEAPLAGQPAGELPDAENLPEPESPASREDLPLFEDPFRDELAEELLADAEARLQHQPLEEDLDLELRKAKEELENILAKMENGGNKS